MGSIEPTRAQIEALAGDTSESPIMMINLLRFAEQADYPEDFDAEPCSGAEAYARYAAATQPFLEGVGGSPVWGAPGKLVVIGPEDEAWDVVVAVRYPSRQAFLEMALNPDYLAITPHRSAALSDSRLILCEAPEDGPPTFGLPVQPNG
jgi:uncharacterized protein (DUF1330 family)